MLRKNLEVVVADLLDRSKSLNEAQAVDIQTIEALKDHEITEATVIRKRLTGINTVDHRTVNSRAAHGDVTPSQTMATARNSLATIITSKHIVPPVLIDQLMVSISFQQSQAVSFLATKSTGITVESCIHNTTLKNKDIFSTNTPRTNTQPISTKMVDITTLDTTRFGRISERSMLTKTFTPTTGASNDQKSANGGTLTANPLPNVINTKSLFVTGTTFLALLPATLVSQLFKYSGTWD